MNQPTLDTWIAERDAAMAQVERNAGPTFAELASAYVLVYLESHGPATGEQLTDACKAQGIVAHSDKAMGPVLMALSRRKLIEKCGYAPRKKGHGCAGANLWKLTQN